MSKIADLSYDIEQLFIEGHSAKMISTLLEYPIDAVLKQLEDMGVADSPEEVYSPYYGA